MKISVILGHPYENSFNAAIAETVITTLKNNGHTAMFHDLGQENFNPILSDKELISENTEDELVLCHQSEIKEADGIVIIHPNWWGQPPAIVKGWIDRVLRKNVAYIFPEGNNGGGFPIGRLKAKAGLVFNTSNTPEERENTVFGDPLHHIWKDCIFGFCGVKIFDRVMFRVIADSTCEERKQWLDEVRQKVNQYFPQ
ncbi:NAD(P)H dehydrogenase (quinone) [Syntrophobotulus glycolicus DSM 8271]|uniref:NAD(P)H dehydrogenase (Quinone) n=1 Tax=Syntrophobotulus glycolicus (strain DSM 8271 / FlGlyR) TaxID=645991 RepID=F0T1X1_SYNGF|nr:NAD(P)H-dependent oxidoreductase [Syntrophobotulus glycolicus]ADY55235.1 NAD(P)H dehydrogenase (quinone) [Syntrophobotulus glycolicus DSM 8271]